MKICGVDPGLKGAIAFADIQRGVIVDSRVYDMPVSDEIDGRPLPDSYAIHAIAKAEMPDTVIMEHVEARPNAGATSGWRFGMGFGETRAAFRCAFPDRRVHLVRPGEWKAALGLSSDKSASLAAARAAFPSLAEYLSRAKDDGRAEALLLIVYFQKVLLRLEEMEVC